MCGNILHVIMWLKWSDDNRNTSVMTFHNNFVAFKVYCHVRVTGGKLLNLSRLSNRLTSWYQFYIYISRLWNKLKAIDVC